MFILPEEDLDFLTLSNFRWETIIERNLSWLIIHEFPVPNGYNVRKVTLALRIDPGYPTSQIDMVYFYPSLIRVDNVPIKALANQPLDNKVFQRWSRHRTPLNPWRPGLDNLESHIMLVKNWLEREFILYGVPS